MKFKLLLAAALLVAAGAGVRAATIERTFEIDASNFSLIMGSSTPLPIDPVELDFTIVFDPAVSTGKTTEGMTINSFNLPYTSAYAVSPPLLIVATHPFPDGCFNEAESYCVFIDNPDSATPTISGQFRETTSSGGIWGAGTATITVVPEPAAWALMLVGFGAVRWLIRVRAGGAGVTKLAA